jgi:hypothetical protein
MTRRIETVLLAVLLILLVRYAYGNEPLPTHEVVCPAFSDWCVYMKDGEALKLRREDLPEYIPIIYPLYTCHIEFCVNVDMEVIGLNPNYFLWRRQ